MFPDFLLPFKGYLVGAVLALLGLSLLGNVVQYHLLGSANEKLSTANATAKTNLDAAELCSGNTKKLKEQAEKDAAVAKKAIEVAKAGQRTAAARAQNILSTPATVPGDACKSATDRATRWLNESN